ncbi:YceI family protein [Novosphingobium sediminicola]|uniref:Polyisoprenoid-binding protein YceI n=1 Tax=Novosphingobium sediminicola TaxID=563162 RepID=A0A7W6CG85_9SPHN|nr:YceI family protein [Novosphingobium sediminicola]MBB3954139.1 polyisoprenoid-binding protein YceI [Novosphingobium sediminicola]
MKLFVLSAALALPIAAHAQTAPVQGGTYKVESHHTLAQFSVNHFGFNDFFGVIPDATGTLVLNPAQGLAGTSLDVSLPVDRISTTNAVLDGELKSADWLDAAKFPTIRFVSQKVEQTGPRTARITGTVTLHGVTKPMVLNATLGGSGVNPMTKAYTVGFSATGTIKRSDFGVTKYVPYVGDDLAISITAAFEKAN